MPNAPDAAAGQPTGVDVNAVILTGYLVRNPELHTTRRGGRMVFLRLAIQRQSASEHDYIDVLLTHEQADHANRLRQGQRVLVTGRLQQHHWRTKKGTRRCKHAIVASNLEPLTASQAAPAS